MSDDRFERQIALFGREGQARLRAARVTVVGVGGVGSIVVPELALLGVGALDLVEHDGLEHHNRNRHLCARASDPVPGTLKVDIGARIVREIDPAIRVRKVPEGLLSAAGFEAVRAADYVLGCVDREGVRLVLTELCAAYDKPYIDIASDVLPGSPPQFGGRVCCAVGGRGCLVCMGLLDQREAREDLETPDERRDREAIYGVSRGLLGRSGPSVVSINGVVASLAVTEFMKLSTSLCAPTMLLNYDGRTSRVTVSVERLTLDCLFCKGLRGAGPGADVERYIRKRIP